MIETSVLACTLLGLAAGAHHALTGPDHLAGVAPLASSSVGGGWRPALRVGIEWGVGHAAGASLAAILALFLRSEIPGIDERLSAISETVVGVLLCILGVLGLSRALRRRPGTHEHGAPRARRSRPAVVLGLVHGAAGMSHLFAVLPALALPGKLLPAAYLAGYGAGSLVTIAAYAAVLGWLARDRGRWVLGIGSAASVAVGALWIVHPV
ncbi:MAG: High-affinity nickel transporter [Planctomycetota bacterium]